MKIEKDDGTEHEEERVMGCSGHCITRCDIMCAFHSGTVRTSSLGRQLLGSSNPHYEDGGGGCQSRWKDSFAVTTCQQKGILLHL